MQTSITCCLMAFCFCFLAAGTEVDGEAALKAQLPEIFAKAAAHYKALDAAATPLMKNPKLKGGYGTPHGWRADKKELHMCSLYWWTAGHYPGSLWYLYEATGEEFFRKRATEWTEIVAPNAKVTDRSRIHGWNKFGENEVERHGEINTVCTAHGVPVACDRCPGDIFRICIACAEGGYAAKLYRDKA